MPPSSRPLPHAHHHPSPLQTLIPHLLPLLPNSFPLLRRLQFPHSSPHAHVFATFPPSAPPPPPPSSSPPPSKNNAELRSPAAPPFPFAATWVDRSRAPETECWIFSTYELHREHGDFSPFPFPLHSTTSSSSIPPIPTTSEADEADGEAEEESRLHLLALLNAIAVLPPLPPPSLTTTTTKEAPDGEKRGLGEIMLLGSLHHALLPLLTDPSSSAGDSLPALSHSSFSPSSGAPVGSDGRGRGVLSGMGEKVGKWFIPPPPPPPTYSTEASTTPLPESYALATLRSEELRLCVSRSEIPRREETLAGLRNACVRYYHHVREERGRGEGKLVAWAFLGVDGSLTSLFVEEGHRGRGLARGVVRGLMRGMREGVEGGGERGGKGEGGGGDMAGWMTSDVYWDNEGGHGVARALGGREGWVNWWVACDLGRCRSVWGRIFLEREGKRGY